MSGPAAATRRPAALAAATACLLAVATFGGCRGPALRNVTAERWINERTVAPLESLDGYREEVVFRWDFGDPQEVARWSSADVDERYSVTPDGLELASAGFDPRLARTTDFAAGDVDVVRVHHDGVAGSYVEVFWVRPGDDWLPIRRLRSEREIVASSGRHTDLAVAEHDQWSGQIVGLRLDPIAVPHLAVKLRAVEGIRRIADGPRLAAELAKPWRVDRDGDARDALLSAVGLPVARSVAVPRERPRLSTAFLAPPGSDGLGRGRVVAEADGRREVLAEFAPEPDARRWQSVDVDLAAFAGRSIRLLLEWQAIQPTKSARLAAWADPRIIVDATAARPNVVLVVVDTLRADRTSLHRGGPPTTPRLASWASRRATVFESTVAPSPWTLPSHVSFLSGLEAFHHSSNQGDAAAPSVELLAERLRDAGFATAAFTGGGYLTPAYGFDAGFARFHVPLGTRGSSDLEAGLKRAMTWLRSAPEPYFLMLHTYDVHAPYTVRPGRADAGDCVHVEPAELLPQPTDAYRATAELVCRTASGERRTLPAESALARDAYDYGIERTDARLGSLIDDLESRGVADRTLLIVTSDHGEALGEHGAMAHSDLYDANLLVPLVAAFPGGLGAGRRVASQVRLIDLVPTVLDAVGLEIPKALDGQSLLPLASGATEAHPREAWSYAASTNRGVSLRVANRWKLIADNSAFASHRPFGGLFALGPSREQRAEGKGELASQLRARILERFAAEAPGVRLTARNRSAVRLRWTLSGRNVTPLTVKSRDFSASRALRQIEGGVGAELLPGEALDLLLEGGTAHVLTIRSDLAGSVQEGQFAPAESAGWSATWSGNAWHVGVSALPEEATGIGLVVVGAAPAGLTAEPDAVLVEQLRSLGYVD